MIEEHVAEHRFREGQGRSWSTSSEYLPKFKKIMPHDYRRMMLLLIAQTGGKGAEQRTGADRSILRHECNGSKGGRREHGKTDRIFRV